MKTILALFMMVFSLSTYSQFTFERHYGASPLNEYGNDLIVAPAGGLYILGTCAVDPARNRDLWLLKTDANNDTLWSRRIGNGNDEYGEQILLSSSQNELLLVGTSTCFDSTTSDILCVKTDLNGNVIWSNTYGTVKNDIGAQIVASSDGGYLLAGLTENPQNPNFYYNVLLVRIDENGQQIWQQIITVNQGSSLVRLSRFSDRSYFLTVSCTDASFPDKMFKISQDGSVIWQKDSYKSLKINSISQNPGGGFLLSGTIRFSDGYSFPAMMLLDDSASKPNTFLFQDSTFWQLSRAMDAKMNSEGELTALVSWNDMASATHYYLWIVNPVTLIYDSHEIPSELNRRWFISFAESPDNEYHILGSTSGVYGASDVLLFTTDRLISFQTIKIFGKKGETGEEGAQSICLTPDGGYLIGGNKSTWSVDSGYINRNYLLKIDAIGNPIWDLIIPSFYRNIIWDVTPAIDGGYLVFSSYDKFRIDKISDDGILQWTSIKAGATGKIFGAVLQKPDGSIYVGGTCTEPVTQNPAMTLVKLSSTGDSVWTKYYQSDTNQISCFDVISTQDGGFVLAGQVNIPGKNMDIVIVKTDADGSLIWTKNYGDQKVECANSVLENPDGTIVTYGTDFSNQYGTRSAMILKVNPNGDSITSSIIGGSSQFTPQGWVVTHASGGGYATLSQKTVIIDNMGKSVISLVSLDTSHLGPAYTVF
ncbi:MAG: hypothetical protein NTU44_19635 [Bacteroidetes bacterium]|nr:hypothetical protein [Bacteroidota bacterium]